MGVEPTGWGTDDPDLEENEVGTDPVRVMMLPLQAQHAMEKMEEFVLKVSDICGWEAPVSSPGSKQASLGAPCFSCFTLPQFCPEELDTSSPPGCPAVLSSSFYGLLPNQC